MARVALFVALFVALIAVAHCEIVELTQEDFLSQVVGGDDNWIVMFYGANCGFCKSVKPFFEDLEQEVEEEGLDLRLAMLDVHKEGTGNDMFYYMPGPLPGIHLFTEERWYEMPNPRYVSSHDAMLEFALFGYEEEGINNYPADKNKRDPDMSDAVVLTKEDFDEKTKEGNWLVMFYGPKCGWCKRFEPLYHEFATEMKDDDSLNVAKIDAFDAMGITQRFTARPWPSVVLVKQDKFYRIDTDVIREAEDVQFMHDFVAGGFEDADEEHSGTNEGLARYLKKEAAKERSRKKKLEKNAAKEDL